MDQLPRGLWEADIPKYIITKLFNNAERYSSRKNLIGCVLGNDRLGEGAGCPPFTFDSSKGIKLPTSNQLRLIRPEVYTTTCSIKTLYLPRHKLQLSPRALGDCVHPEDIVMCSLDHCEQNGYLTISIGYVWGKQDVRRGLGLVHRF